MTWGFHNIPLIGFLFDEETVGVPSFIKSQKNSDKLERHYPAIKEAMNGVFTKKANGSNPPYNW
nr:hypothetical protein [Candidatus Mycoplasma haematolamae]